MKDRRPLTSRRDAGGTPNSWAAGAKRPPPSGASLATTRPEASTTDSDVTTSESMVRSSIRSWSRRRESASG